jgi:uncharacterized protein
MLWEDLMKDIEEKEGNYPEHWVFIKVDEAYIHCSKHIPKLKYMDKNIIWMKNKGKGFPQNKTKY